MNEALQTKVRQVLVEWYQAGLCPRNLLNEDHNANEIFAAVYAEAAKYQGRIDVADITRTVMSLGDIDRGGRLRYHKPATQATPVPSNPAANLPDADEPLLKNLRCLEDINERGAEIIKKVMQLGGGADKAGVHNVLLEKLNRRLAYIQTHRIKRADLPPQPVETKPQPTVVRRVEDPRVTAIRDRIAIESKGYTGYAHKKGERLNAMLNELLRDPSRQIYRDRSRGGVEEIRGMGAIERLMSDAIRDYDSPFGHV